MNWIIFTTECSGKTTFCKTNANKIGKHDLIDYDKVKVISDEVILIDIMLELKNKDNQIYLTNIVPPDFILNCNKHFENLSFGIIKISERRSFLPDCFSELPVFENSEINRS